MRIAWVLLGVLVGCKHPESQVPTEPRSFELSTELASCRFEVEGHVSDESGHVTFTGAPPKKGSMVKLTCPTACGDKHLEFANENDFVRDDFQNSFSRPAGFWSPHKNQ